MTDAGLIHLKGLADLKRLSLDGCRISDAGLAHLGGLKNLEELSLPATEVTDAGLARLKGLRKLRKLRLQESNCTLAGVVHLFTALQNRGLDEALEIVVDVKRDEKQQVVSLDLSGIQVHDAGLEYLKDFKNLKWLHLYGTQVTDAGLAHLEQLGELELLNLAGTKITDAGLAHLDRLPNLRTVHLSGTNVTDQGIDKLRQASSRGIRVYRREFSHLDSDQGDQKNASSHVKLGNAMLKLGRIEEARTHFLKAIARQPNRKEAYYGLGLMFHDAGRMKEAAAHFRQVLRIDPGHADAHIRLGLILLDDGLADEGREHLASAVRISPRNPSANYRYGYLLHREGKLAEAAVHYQRAIQSDPGHVLAMLALAGIRINSDHPDLHAPKEAVALAEKACELTEHKSAEALEMLAQIYARTGRLDDAIGTANQALQIARSDRDDYLVGRLQKNLSLYQRALDGKPQ